MDIRGFIKEKRWKKWKKDQWLIVFLAGVLMLVIAIPAENDKKSQEERQEVESVSKISQKSELSTNSSYEEQLEKRLEEILRSIDGVGQVKVMITLKDSGEAVVEKDKESSYQTVEGQDEAGSKTIEQQTSETTVYENQTEEGGPFIAKKTKPEVEGVLVVAQGGNNAVTAQNISEAIQALFDIEVHKIKIVKMNMQEGTN